MKIVCDACQAKYSISDDKVQGKVFKIRCKKCSNIIVVRGSGGGAAEPAPQPAAEKDTRVYDYGYEGGAPAGDEAVWHVVINQDQVGPMTVAEVQQRFSAGEIDFVEDPGDGHVGRQCGGLEPDLLVIGAARRIDDIEDAIGAGHLDASAANSFGFDDICFVSQAGGIGDVQRHAIYMYALAQHVPRRARNVSDNGSFIAREPVHQARLASVRSTGDDDRHAVAEQCALACGRDDPFAEIERAIESFAQRAVREEVDFLLGEVDRRLDMHASLGDGFRQRMNLRGKLALQ